MSDDNLPTPLSDAEVEHLLQQLKPKIPLTREELEDLRVMSKEWKRKKDRREDLRKALPIMFGLIASIAAAGGFVISYIVNFAQKHSP